MEDVLFAHLQENQGHLLLTAQAHAFLPAEKMKCTHILRFNWRNRSLMLRRWQTFGYKSFRTTNSSDISRITSLCFSGCMAIWWRACAHEPQLLFTTLEIIWSVCMFFTAENSNKSLISYYLFGLREIWGEIETEMIAIFFFFG